MHGEKVHAYGMRILKGFRPNGPLAAKRDITCIAHSIRSILKPFILDVPRGGGGGHSTFMWTGGAAGCRKPDPVAKRSVHTKYTLSQYTLLKKKSLCIPCRNIAPSLVPRSRACHKHCGLGSPGKQPCDKWSSPPVANLADLDTQSQY